MSSNNQNLTELNDSAQKGSKQAPLQYSRVSMTAVILLEQRSWGTGQGGGGMFKRNPHKDSFKRVVYKKPLKPILKELSLQRDIVVSNVSHRSGTPLENSHQQSLTAKKNYHLWIPIQRTTGLNALVFHFHLQLLLSLHTPHSDTWGH